MLDIYPAREAPIEGVTSTAILEKMTALKKEIVTKESLSQKIAAASQKVVVMMGAGDIGVEILKVTQYLQRAS